MKYKFEVHRDGKLIMGTNSEEAFYPPAVIKQMIGAGYKIYKDGKIHKPPAKKKNKA
jgi:hypothetical protein